MLRMFIRAAMAATLIAAPALAHDGVHIVDPYARVSGPSAQSGAVFLVIENHGDADDRLIAASSDVAARVELHTHREDSKGVMQMVEVEGGFVIPAGGTHALERGGDHVMLMGLNRSLKHGDVVTVTLTFERGDVITLDVPVDLERKPGQGMGHDHGHGHAHGHKHGG
ncbi:MAG: copper chaperone PCu(A)C [Gemmobacter sp.]